MQTYYELLGVSENASEAEIETAFKSKAREVHPDKVPPGNPYLRKVAAEAFKDLSEAKSVLLDRNERQKYDAGLAYMRGAQTSSASSTPPPPTQPKQSSGGHPQQQQPSRTTAAPPSSATGQSFWGPANTPFGLGALLIGVVGILLLFGGIAYPALVLLCLSLALLSWRHGMRPGTDPKFLGGSVFLFIFALIFFAGSIESGPSAPPQSNSTSSQAAAAIAASAAPQTRGPNRMPVGGAASPISQNGKAPNKAKTQSSPAIGLEKLDDGRIIFSNSEPGSSNEPPTSHKPTTTIANKTWKNLKDGQIYRSRFDGNTFDLETTNPYPKTDGDIVSCKFHRATSLGLSWTGDCWERNRRDNSVYKSVATVTTFSETRIDMSTGDMAMFTMVGAENSQDGSSQGIESPQSRSSLSSEHTQAIDPEKVHTNSAQTARHGLSTVSDFERASIESACSYHKNLNGPAAYYNCLEQQLVELRAAPRRPDLSRIGGFEKQSIESACSYHKNLNGPAAYYACLEKQLAELKVVSRRPDLSMVNSFEKQSIESACAYHKNLNGPAAYYQCLQMQLDLLKKSR